MERSSLKQGKHLQWWEAMAFICQAKESYDLNLVNEHVWLYCCL